MQFPLQTSFKFFALSNEISVTDASGQLILYVKQKAFKLKECIDVFADTTQQQQIYSIQADRILDISAAYQVKNTHDQVIGRLKRHGMKSFWRTHYDVEINGKNELTITEKNPWIKVIDSFLGDIPVLGLLTGYFLNPTYLVKNVNQEVVFEIIKRPALFESTFSINQLHQINTAHTEAAVVSMLMTILIERTRG